MFPRSPFLPPKENLPFTGIATFAGYPLWQEEQNVDAVVLGIPYDEGTTYRPGTRFGPRAIRDASMFYSYEGAEGRFYDADRRRWILSGKKVADAGDVPIEPLCLEKNWKIITNTVKSILDSGAAPAVVGGDHSITFPVVRAFQGRKIHYVHFDTHVDCDRISYSTYTHGSPVLLISEQGLADSITIIGVRGLTNAGQDIAWIEEKGIRTLTARELRKWLQEDRASLFKEGDYYVSLDIDFFDPSLAPGTGTPEPGGLFFEHFSDVLHILGKRGNIVGFDVVEVNPFLDGRGGITAHLAARCVLELMSVALDKR
jgi:agmatinase